MTPKEKAKELVDKLYQTTPNEAWYNPPLGSLSLEYKAWEQAKECAMIAVDEILDSYAKEKSYGFIISEKIIPYWQEVKNEIETL
jgi:predicted Zn-dependent protease